MSKYKYLSLVLLFSLVIVGTSSVYAKAQLESEPLLDQNGRPVLDVQILDINGDVKTGPACPGELLTINVKVSYPSESASSRLIRVTLYINPDQTTAAPVGSKIFNVPSGLESSHTFQFTYQVPMEAAAGSTYFINPFVEGWNQGAYAVTDQDNWDWNLLISDNCDAPTMTNRSYSQMDIPIDVPPYRILFEFDQDMNAATIDESAITLETLDGTPIPGKVMYESRFATFVPSITLDYNTTYIVRVKGGLGGVQSITGMSQESDTTWTFTTESLSAVGPLVYSSYTVDDDNSSGGSGNGDGDVDPGETVKLKVFLGNTGESTASSVNGSVSSTDPNISFPGTTSSSYDNIRGYGTEGNNNDFLFFVDQDTPCGYLLPFDIDTSAAGGITGQDTFSIPVSCNAPTVPSDPSPAQDKTGVSLEPTLGVTVSDPDVDPLMVTFYGREKITPAVDDFEFIVIPDTQYYSCNGNIISCPPLVPNINDGRITTFISQTQWIVDNQASIAYAPHMGDVVQNADWFEGEWVNGDSAMDVLESGAPQIPYGISMGNHDLRSLFGINPIVTGDTFMNQYFGVERFNGRSYYGGHFSFNNNSHYILFEAGGMEFISIHIEYSREYEDAQLVWVDNLLKGYATRRAIVVRHALIDEIGNFVEDGDRVHQLLRENPNLFLMLSGHIDGEYIRSDPYNNGTVYTILSDYQNEPNGGDGWLRQLKFSPQNNKINIRSYTPLTDRWDWDSPLATGEQELNYDMGYNTVEVAKRTGVTSGSVVSTTWGTRLPETNYEWYVTVSDGVNTTISPVWNFTTGKYVLPACYKLTLGNTGAGDPPTASPANSEGCPSGEYVSGETIDVTAHPADGYHVSGWTGTVDDASTSLSNQVIMPGEVHDLIVHYEKDIMVFLPSVYK